MSSSPDHVGRFVIEIDILGIDLAKHVFQLHGAERSGRAVHRSTVGRGALIETVLPPGLRPRYEKLGYTPPSARKAGSWLVPLPATYLLDRDGVVVLASVDVDYRNHFESKSLVTAVKALQ